MSSRMQFQSTGRRLLPKTDASWISKAFSTLPAAAPARRLFFGENRIYIDHVMLHSAWLLQTAETEGRKLLKQLIKEKFGGKGRVLSFEKVFDEDDLYYFDVAVPEDIFLDIETTSEVGGQIVSLGKQYGVDMFVFYSLKG